MTDPKDQIREEESELTNEEVEQRLRATLIEEGEDPDSDSDHAMYLRQDIANEIRQEKAKLFRHSNEGVTPHTGSKGSRGSKD